MSESSTPPGPMSTTSRDESPTSRPAKPRPEPSQKAKATTKRKALDEKDIENRITIPFLFATYVVPGLPIKRKYFNIFPLTQK